MVDETPEIKTNGPYNAAIDTSLARRARYLNGFTHMGDRDLYKVLGYPQEPLDHDYLKLYYRNDIANRLIRAYPQATWRDDPVLDDNKDEDGIDEESEFVKAWKNLIEKHKVMHYLERADRLSGLGQFSVLVMGFNDGKRLDEPLEPGNHPLLYLAPYGEVNVIVNKWDQDQTSPRFGKPITYTCQRGNALSESRSATRSIVVHYTRVLHIAEFLDDDETYGMPRLKPVYNRLLDLEKLSGGSAEAFWLTANRGLVLAADADAELTAEDRKKMMQEAEDYQHQLRRILTLQGATATSLGADTPQPKEAADFILSLVAGATGIPQRILLGSEQGELASSQDENNWSARVDERRASFAAPMILRPFIQKLIETGNLPEPETEWSVYWEAGASLSEDVLAGIAQKKSLALRDYLSIPNADLVVSVNEFRELIGLDPRAEPTFDELDYIEIPEDEPTDDSA